MLGNGRWRGWTTASFLFVVAWLGSASTVTAESPGEPAVKATASNFNPTDNAWVLISAALVLMMTAPGLALFYCGLVRRKNVLGVMMQCVFLMCLMTLLWAIYGYTLVFGDGPWIGDFRYLFMRGVDAT
jgi:ammonium transporter, Amt family